AAPVVHGRFAGGQQLLPALLELLGRAVAVVGLALGQELLGVLAVNLQPLALLVGAIGSAHLGTLVPVDLQPPQGVDDGPGGLFGGTLQIGILDAQHEGAAVMAGKQPVEQCRPGPAHVEKPRGAWGIPGADFLHPLAALLSSGPASAWAAMRARPASYGGRTTPNSVMIAVT